MKAALIGNPNCGKTTLFNALTGSNQRVGNWPGVTVERKNGFFSIQDESVEVIDLPGTYSLIASLDDASIDEKIVCEFIQDKQFDVLVNIIDANNLERNLYLTLQLLEMKIPMIIAVNMLDVAEKRHQKILLRELEKQLDCKVIPLKANKQQGIDELKKTILKFGKQKAISKKNIAYPEPLQEVIHEIARQIHASEEDQWVATRLLEGDSVLRSRVSDDVLALVEQKQQLIQAELQEDADILFADARYQFIQQIMAKVLQKPAQKIITLTEKIDQIVLNRFLGIPIFLFMMYCMFLFAINIGGAFQEFFDISSNTIFVGGFAELLKAVQLPQWLIAILAQGVGKGINTVVTFIPVIGAMFLFLAFLEDSGYMARAAFVVDRIMRAVGLPGKSFVPMIVGFGCNVPAIMATRTLENQRDRILTVMMSPFMSCGARLAIYSVFIAAFFPVGGHNIVFALYLIGILMAVLTGLLLRKTVLQGNISPLVMELPPYHVPQWKTIFLHAWQRLKSFVVRAGKLIVPVCMVIGVLNTLNTDLTLNAGGGDTQSLLSVLGKMLTPIFNPLGIHQDNWPATVGLVTGVLAKEVVIGTLNTLYSQLGHVTHLQLEAFNLWQGLAGAFASIPHNLLGLGSSFINPVLAKAPVHTLTADVYGVMYQRFDGKAGAFAYLLFILLYLPCVSTTAAIAKELNRTWALFSMFWTTLVAYAAAVLFYQMATFHQHPLESLLWMAGIATLILFILWGAKRFTQTQQSKNFTVTAIKGAV